MYAGVEQQQAAKEGKPYRWGAPYPVQLRVLLQRTLKTRRFEALSSRDFLQFLIVGVLAGKLLCCTCVSCRGGIDFLLCGLVFCFEQQSF